MAANDLYAQIVTPADEDNFSKSPSRPRHGHRLLAQKLPLVTQALADRAPILRAAEPIVVKLDQPELFVDDYVIQSHAGLQRRLHQPAKDDRAAKPILSLRDLGIPVAGTLEANGSILYDTRLKKHVMLALALRTPWDGWDKTQLFRFTSPDGIHWTVGDDGLPQPVFLRRRKDLHDPENGLYASNIDLCSFVYDARDQGAPYKGWIWFANMGELEGLFLLEGENLFVNGIGPIRLEVLKSGQPVASARMQDDSLRHRVTFDGKTLQALAGGTAVQLQFEVQAWRAALFLHDALGRIVHTGVEWARLWNAPGGAA